MRLVILAMVCLFCGCQKKQVVQAPVFQVDVVKPKVEDVRLFKSYVGNVQPYVQVEVQAQVEGVLTDYYFVEGQDVKKGDLIFRIDERPYVAQLHKAEAALALSVANLRYAEDVARRNASLAQKDYVSKLQFDQYITDVLTAKATIQENEADIETAKINISYCNIHAPMDAVTGKLQIQVGNLITNSGETLILLNQITPTYAYFSVPQNDLPGIMALHRQEPLDVEAFLRKTPYKGKLDLIDNQVNDQTGAIWLRGVFPNEEKQLWPGEFVDVRLYVGEQKNAVLIPTEAISIGQKGKYVFVIKEDNTAELRYITTGQRIDEMTIIDKGVESGENVVVQGQINLANGAKVNIRKQGSKTS